MVIFANSTGNRFGAVCRGSSISPGLDGGREPIQTECGTVQVEYVTNDTVPGSALYRDDEPHFQFSHAILLPELKFLDQRQVH